ncbi:MAG: hypothetical protein HOP22_01940 [Nitrospiraceae bacterium]|jgi:hypothetical protein|nr:hypothetical protein [Nitrospiraceae bacterium]
MEENLDRYQLAGLDAKERGFSRPLVFERVGEDYRAVLRYETVLIKTEASQTQDESLRILVQTLQAQGYRQLRTQMSFRNNRYLGSQELWIEYPDPEIEPERTELGHQGVVAKFLNWIRPRNQ